MKVILTGATGFIGSEVLKQCIANPTITTVVALSRRALKITDQKLEVIILQDFNTYTDSILRRLEDADACIWCMGTTAAIPEIEIDYPVAFARAMTPRLKKSFRYLHLSGVLAERDQEKRLLFLQGGRRIKGRAETELLKFEAEEKKNHLWWQTFVVKPAMVLKVDEGWVKIMAALLVGSVRVDVLALCMIGIVVNGSERRILDNAEIVLQGTNTLERNWRR